MGKKNQNAAENQDQQTADPFADLPTVKLNEATVADTSGLDTADPRKYKGVHEAAVAGKLPVKPNWKHGRAILSRGQVPCTSRPDSVMATAVEIVGEAGREGIAAYDVATQLRRRQMNNKRSHYASGKVPPVGWAEGYIDHAIRKGFIKVQTTKEAPALTEAPAEEAGDGENGDD